MKAFLTFLSLSVLCLGLTGCGEGGPALGQVEGTVKYKGAPVAGATITFVMPDGQIASGATGPDGKYTLMTGSRNGAPIGTASVGITKFGSVGAAPTAAPADPTAAPGGTPDLKAQMEQMMAAGTPKNELPEKYADPKTSGLTAPVVAGGKDKNTHNFDLVD